MLRDSLHSCGRPHSRTANDAVLRPSIPYGAGFRRFLSRKRIPARGTRPDETARRSKRVATARTAVLRDSRLPAQACCRLSSTVSRRSLSRACRPLASRPAIFWDRARTTLSVITSINVAADPETVMRKVLHIDMDAFYASVEQRDDPTLRGRPVVVAWKGPRSVVCAASYEARRFGIHSAMPAMRAERLCPAAVFVPPDFARYKRVSGQIQEIFSRHTDLVEPLSLDEAYLDVTVNTLALPSATHVARMIRAAIHEETGLTASAGVAPNKFLAKIASDWNKPDGLYVIRPPQVMAFLAGLPVGKLPGVGKVMESRLRDLGIQRVDQLRELPVDQLERSFGRWGLRLHQLSMGIDESAVRPHRVRKQISTEDTFPDDRRLDQLEIPVRQLAERAWNAAVRQSMPHPHTIVLKLKTHDFINLSRSQTLPAPPRSAADIIEVAKMLMGRVTLPADTRYRLVGIGLAGFKSPHPDMRQGDLFTPGTAAEATAGRHESPKS